MCGIAMRLAPSIVADIEWAVVALTGLIAVVSLVRRLLGHLPSRLSLFAGMGCCSTMTCFRVSSLLLLIYISR